MYCLWNLNTKHRYVNSFNHRNLAYIGENIPKKKIINNSSKTTVNMRHHYDHKLKRGMIERVKSRGGCGCGVKL